jgi:hypothetical protein
LPTFDQIIYGDDVDVNHPSHWFIIKDESSISGSSTPPFAAKLGTEINYDENGEGDFIF